MKVHLIKDSGVSAEVFTEVLDLLNAVPGPLQFPCDSATLVDFNKEDIYDRVFDNEEDFIFKKSIHLQCESIENETFDFPLHRNTIAWNKLFKACEKYRQSKRLPLEDFVLVLTEKNNERNWFASLDPKMPFNGFIQTTDWTYFIKCAPSFPVAYEVIALILQKAMFDSIEEVDANAHEDPIGCVNDFCLNKKDIILKLRTADICPDCMAKLKEKLSFTTIQHAIRIMESLRKKMLFSQNFKQAVELSPIHIDASNRIFLPGFENIEIKLTPLEKTLYFLYLRHPEGIGLSYLTDFKEEMYGIYAEISGADNINEMRARINDMANITTGSASEKISKIKSKFIKAIGEELAKHYYIQGGNGEVKKVNLDKKGLLN